MTAYVYTFRNRDGEPLYVGCTEHPRRRMREHSRWLYQPWANFGSVEVQRYADLKTARAAESARIFTLQPSKNVVGKGDDIAASTAYGRKLAALHAMTNPLTDEQVEQAARIFARLPQQRTP